MKEENNMEKILELINVEKYYGSKGNITKALLSLDFSYPYEPLTYEQRCKHL